VFDLLLGKNVFKIFNFSNAYPKILKIFKDTYFYGFTYFPEKNFEKPKFHEFDNLINFA
jgi:hypothetical protein